ncbi:P-loop containing nucleoside triphosphate hydrolase protein [Lipomyces tetrasporus]|uniref:Ribosome-releasing factor 2, mitochondrial n=1 Tax=Lipomyces tetrasporus TaxID=54092 RepID=A0AAD7QM55_9ASCO|nr:P-loop containing nucleoside triphosphate hydrolase protein [Lipomyces tetrasporus]KAJ8097738.1 P-loop containing nucleoside triphosphate hydrolase protein [Lipomyces tetrasporus]
MRLPSVHLSHVLEVSRSKTTLCQSSLGGLASLRHKLSFRRAYAVAQRQLNEDAAPETDIRRVRNIGIIAHIDAGKTTTTERMLYYSGYTKRIGNVDEGDTVMDYLPVERDRGITITSAAISFDWNVHRINLIDTPGHADFTFEVIRSIRVLDGAVTVLDGVEGVEAQTEKVWQQAQEMKIPRIVFVNKMDREGAGFGRTVREIVGKLSVRTCIINMPLFKKVMENGMTSAKFCGVIDVLEMKSIEWVPGSDGQQFIVGDLEGENLEEAMKARVAIVETLAELDDDMVEKFLEMEDDHLAISSHDIKAALRKCTLQNLVVPVLCGASFRNIGVQPLLDAVVDYLPSPVERPPAILRTGKTTLSVAETDIGYALAFKVVHDNHSGKILVFIRVYSGTLRRLAKIYNTSNGTEEKALKLSRMYADASVDIEAINEGHIGVISGTKDIRTGDTIIFDYQKSGGKTKFNRAMMSMQLNPIKVPSPVFFASVEPKTVSDTRPMELGLQALLREDPSLQVSVDEETGQTHLSGMGELHLEIASDRLVRDMKVKAQVGKIQISYRESIEDNVTQDTPVSYTYKSVNKGAETSSYVALLLRPIPEDLDYSHQELKKRLEHCVPLGDNNFLTFDETYDFAHPKVSQEDVYAALRVGVTAGLLHGKRYGLPMHSVLVIVKRIELPVEQDSATPVTPTARFAISKFLESIPLESKVLMEPVMDVTVIVDEEDIGSVMSDISSARSGRVYALEDENRRDSPKDHGDYIDPDHVYSPPDHTLHLSKHNIRRDLHKRLIRAKVPLSEMVGYLKYLRAMTQGRGSFLMTFDRYERASKDRATSIWQNHYN